MSHRWITKIWLILAALFIGACSGSTEIEDISNEESLKGRLVIWFSFPESKLSEVQVDRVKKAVNSNVNRFNQLYPDVDIVLEWKNEATIVEEFGQQVEKGLGPDLVYTNYINLPILIQRGVVRNLNQFRNQLELSKFRSEALSQVNYQGNLYGLPLDLITQVLCYNKEKVKEIPETLSELRMQANQGYSVGMQSSFSVTFWGIQAFGEQLLDAQERIIVTRLRSWAKWMEWLKTVKEEPNFILNEDYLALQTAFIEGNLAYMTCFSPQIPYLREALGQNRLGVTLLPGSENYPAGSPLRTNAFVFSSASSPAQTQLALRLSRFMTNTEQQRLFTVEFPGFIPANQDATIDRRLFPIQGILQEQSKTGIAISLDEGEKINAIVNYGNELYFKVLAGEITPDAAVSLIIDTINSRFGAQSPE